MQMHRVQMSGVNCEIRPGEDGRRGSLEQSVCHSLHARCKNGQRDNDADQKRANSRHDTVEVAPPSCFLEGLVVGGPHRLGELLFQVGLAGSWGTNSVRVEG